MNNFTSLLKSNIFWTIIGTIATVITTFPIIKDTIQASKEINMTIGTFTLKGSQHISLYYIVPHENTSKFQLPIPLRFINTEETAIENFMAYANINLKKVICNNKELGYMKRILTNQEKTNAGKQHIYISSKTFVSKGSLDLSTEDYMLNVVNENNNNENDVIWDTFNFDLYITHDNQQESQKIHFDIFCCFSQDFLKTEQILKSNLTDHSMNFLIHTTKAYVAKQNDSILITICKLADETNSIIRIKNRYSTPK